jgi:NADH-quinone oxidoreductase subunit G
VISASGAKAVAAIVSSRLSVEDLHLVSEVIGGSIGVPRIAIPPHIDGDDDELLIRADKTPNLRGAALLGLGRPDAAGIREIADDIGAGRIRALIVVGEDPVGERLIPASALQKLEALVVIDSWRSPTVEAADTALPCAGYGEYEGVYVNFEGRAQRSRTAVRAAREIEPAWRLLRELGRRFGLAAEYRNTAAVFDEVAARHKAFAGLSYRALGRHGVPVKEA